MDAPVIAVAHEQQRWPNEGLATTAPLPDVQQLIATVRQCLSTLPAIRPKGEPTSQSATTQADYLKLAKHLIRQGAAAEGGLVSVVNNTGRPSTFYKRMAALRYYCFHSIDLLASKLPHAMEAATHGRLQASCQLLLLTMNALIALQRQGMTHPRQKRRSKRQALRGLPPAWREDLIERGAHGKYADALLVSALTGARPCEVVTGIEAWLAHDDDLGIQTVCLDVAGAKVKAQHQGQPRRFMAYSVNDPHPLVAALVRRLSTAPNKKLRVHIARAGNFTAEVQRLGRSLWRDHGHAITATCFRHQWSADVKSTGDADAASRGLGHRSAKTRRHYGTAHQARGANALRPVRVEADLPIKALQPTARPADRAPRLE